MSLSGLDKRNMKRKESILIATVVSSLQRKRKDSKACGGSEHMLKFSLLLYHMEFANLLERANERSSYNQLGDQV